MDETAQDLRELMRMATLLKGAAARALFQDCSVVFLGVAELLERRAVAIAETAPEIDQPPPPVPQRYPVDILI